MKKLYLIRHARSSKDIPNIKDSDRPLNKRGKKDARKIARSLKKLGLKVDAVYSSPAKRAFDTARAIAKRIGFARGKIKIEDGIYYTTVPRLLKVIKGTDDKAASAAIFGHNPEFLNLLNYLVPGSMDDFPAGAVIGIDLDIDSWKTAARKKGKIVLLIAP